jgi:hypothetical protein
MKTTTGILAVLALASTPDAASAQWSEDFDSYALNALLVNVSTWEELDNNSAASQTKVKDVAAGAAVRSAPHSVWVRGTSDTIHQYGAGIGGGPYTNGQWTLTGHIYKPLTTTGFSMSQITVYEILNEYAHGGVKNVSARVDFDPAGGTWDVETATTTYTGPAIFDQWVELRAEIDLDADSVELFYDGVSMGPAYPWNGGNTGFGSGSDQIACVRLFAHGFFVTTSRVYYDDFTLQPASGCSPTAASYCTSGTSTSGCQAVLSSAGTASPSAGSGFTVTAALVEGAKDGLYFYGQNGQQASPWGNGTSFQCVVPPVQRGGLLTGTGTSGNCSGSFSQDLNARWCPSCPKPGHAPTPGSKLQVQLWYRDPLNTSNQTTSLSDALEVDVCP